MEGIDYAIASLENPLITVVSAAINNQLGFLLLVLAIVLITEKRNEKRKKIIAALLVTLIIGSMIKELYAVERPCIEGILKVACPHTYSFPSLHAAVAFTLMLSFINKRSYWLYLLFALLTAFSRIYIGVHTFDDVAAAIVVSAISYYVVDTVVKTNDNR